MKLRKILTYTAFLALGLLPTACGQDGPTPPDIAEPGMVSLVLKMAVNPGRAGDSDKSARYASTTRAEDYGFEKPTNMYEGVRTLRILIIRQTAKNNNLVEYNSFITFPDDDRTLWDSLEEYVYKVVAGEKKRIYLIANETSVSEAFASMLASLSEGSEISLSDLDNVTLTTNEAAPYIDNQSGTSRRFVPMTEIFEATMPNQGVNKDDIYRFENALFLTRSLSKFSFTVNTATSAADYGINGLQIKSITITGKDGAGCFADQAWLFPHGLENPEDPENTTQIAGGAIYNPGKYEPSTEVLNGKAIVNFTTPTDAKTEYTYTFTPPSFGIPGTKDNTTLSSSFAPLTYFLESPCQEFYVTLTAESNGLEQTFGPALLHNLPYFARNTHAKVEFSFSGEELSAEVDVVPYIGIVLNPGFGFEELLPGDHIQPEDW